MTNIKNIINNIIHNINNEKEKFIFTLIILIISLFRLILIFHIDLGVDEAHYALYGKYIDWSYFDHPPLTGWINGLFISIFGLNEFAVRIPSIILSIINSILLLKILNVLKASFSIKIWTLLAINFCFILNALSFMLLPDSILITLTILFVLNTLKLEQTNHLKYFCFLGIILGLSGLTKYSSFILPFILIIFWIKQKKLLDYLYNKGFYLMIFIAFLFILPIIYWNWQNDFISFRYQYGHVLAGKSLNLISFGKSFLIELIAFYPFYFFYAYLAFFILILYFLPSFLLRPPFNFIKKFVSNNAKKNNFLFVLFILSLSIVLFFLYSSFYNVVLPHWKAIFYFWFIPLGIYFLLNFQKKIVRLTVYFSIILNILITLILYAEVFLKIYPFKDYKTFYKDVYGWPQIMTIAEKIIKEDMSSSNKKSIAVSHWTLASRAWFYKIKKNINYPLYVIDDRFDQFDIWGEKLFLEESNDKNKYKNKNRNKGKSKNKSKNHDLLIINTHFFDNNWLNHIKCDEINLAKSIFIEIKNYKINKVQYWWCRNSNY